MEGWEDTRTAAKRLNISPSRVRHYLKAGRLEGQKISGIWFIKKGSVPSEMRYGRPPKWAK